MAGSGRNRPPSLTGQVDLTPPKARGADGHFDYAFGLTQVHRRFQAELRSENGREAMSLLGETGLDTRVTDRLGLIATSALDRIREEVGDSPSALTVVDQLADLIHRRLSDERALYDTTFVVIPLYAINGDAHGFGLLGLTEQVGGRELQYSAANDGGVHAFRQHQRLSTPFVVTSTIWDALALEADGLRAVALPSTTWWKRERRRTRLALEGSDQSGLDELLDSFEPYVAPLLTRDTAEGSAAAAAYLRALRNQTTEARIVTLPKDRTAFDVRAERGPGSLVSFLKTSSLKKTPGGWTPLSPKPGHIIRELLDHHSDRAVGTPLHDIFEAWFENLGVALDIPSEQAIMFRLLGSIFGSGLVREKGERPDIIPHTVDSETRKRLVVDFAQNVADLHAAGLFDEFDHERLTEILARLGDAQRQAASALAYAKVDKHPLPLWDPEVSGLTAEEHWREHFEPLPYAERPTMGELGSVDSRFLEALRKHARYRKVDFDSLLPREPGRRRGRKRRELTEEDALRMLEQKRAWNRANAAKRRQMKKSQAKKPRPKPR